MTKVVIKGEDTAIVIRASGDFELYTPTVKDIDEPVGQPTIIAAALARILSRKELIEKAIDDMVAETDADVS